MILQINGKNETLDGDRLTVNQLLDVKDVPDPDMVSVQLNGEILERDDFSDQLVKDGDELEFLYFMGGGRGTGGTP
ncbi:MAG: sulfur carrier protein ThiS [Spirochaetaceae bacterium]|nr:sulfur carrier protein ThiS [Spirochaetaceae bacterium]MDT8296734.1 sulfur carrier protein ThiS [Spirochaetaceae bacterium]